MKVYDDTIAFKVEDCDPKKKGYCGNIKVVKVFGELGMIFMILNAVTHNNCKGKEEKNVRCHRNISQIFEGSKPTNRNHDESNDTNIEALHLTLFISCLEAYHLVHLFANKEQVRNNKSYLRYHDADVNKSFTSITKSILP